MSAPTAHEARDYSTVLELRDTQAVGRPYRYLEGRAVPYDQWADLGWFLEQHRAGSFKKSTREAGKSLPLLLFHNNASMPIGHADQWTHEADGLRGVWKLNDSAPAQEAARMAEAGDLLGLSVGFQDVRTPEWVFPDTFDPDFGPEGKARVTRLESRLVEVSMTPTPAFADAAVTLVRTRAMPPKPAPAKEREVDAWRRVVDGLRSA